MNKITLIKFSFIYRIFLCFLVLLLIEGVFHFYYYLISQKFTFITYKEQTGYNNIIWSENGLVELLQVIFLLITIILFFNFLKKNFNYSNLTLKALKLLYLSGILYYFFENKLLYIISYIIFYVVFINFINYKIRSEKNI